MSIISPLPYTFANNTTADATQVDANFDAVVNSVNTNAVPLSMISTDGTLAADSDSLIPSQKAVKTYVDARTIPYIGAVGQVGGSFFNLVNGAGPTALPYSTTLFDTNSLWSNSNPTRFTIPSGITKAIMRLSLDLTSVITPAFTVTGTLNKNGTPVRGTCFNNGISEGMDFSFIVEQVTAGDYLELVLTNTSGSNVHIVGGNSIVEVQLFN